MLIGGLAKATGTKINTIRFYEDIGLMPEAERTPSGQRTYIDQDVERLTFIRSARKLGFSISEARSLLKLKDAPSERCQEAMNIAARHLRGVDERLAQLTALRGELLDITLSCKGGTVSDCKIIDSLSRSSQEHHAGSC